MRSCCVVPSRRSLAIGVGLIALACGAYRSRAGDVGSSPFGASRCQAARPCCARTCARSSPRSGHESLLALNGSALEQRVAALPTVVSATYDRAFPHTLRIAIVPETPVAVLHRGAQTWLVSARARVISRLVPGTRPLLPRIWVPTATPGRGGSVRAPDLGRHRRPDARPRRALPGADRDRHAGSRRADVPALRSGLELRFGAPTDIRLKLAIARRALRVLPGGSTYLDVSVPGRPVAGQPLKSQVEVESIRG